jgi:hypothetical protein
MALPAVLHVEFNTIRSMIRRANATSVLTDGRAVRRAVTNISAWSNMTPEQWAKREAVVDAVEPWVQEVQANFWTTGDDDERSKAEALLADVTAF